MQMIFILAITIYLGTFGLYSLILDKKVRKEEAMKQREEHRKQQKERRKQERELCIQQNNLKEYYNSNTLDETELKDLVGVKVEVEENKTTFGHNSFDDYFNNIDVENEPNIEELENLIINEPNSCILDSDEFVEENMYNFRKKHGLLSIEEINAGKNLPMNERNTAPRPHRRYLEPINLRSNVIQLNVG